MRADEQLALRQNASLPWLKYFYAWVDADDAGPTRAKTHLDEAMTYAKSQRPFIERCFANGRFALDTGRVERYIREPTVNRENYPFVAPKTPHRS